MGGIILIRDRLIGRSSGFELDSLGSTPSPVTLRIKMRTEKELMLQVKNRLSVYEMTGEIIWHTRLNSLSVKTIYGGRVRGCKEGTPDWIVLVRGRADNILALFIECKSDKGTVRPKQSEFISKYGTKEGVFVMVLRDIRDLDKWIDKNAKDFVSLI